MDAKGVKRPPRRRRQDRVILQFDYDCFYAQVFENKTPELKSKPLGVKQKNLLATCNYNARSHGVKKLMPVSEATQICPGLVLVDGEDLTLFRDTSKLLFNFLKSHSWNGRAERLGFDEVFLDVTDIVEYSLSCLNLTSLQNSFFHLSSKDPESGFGCDLTSPAGCLVGAPANGDDPAEAKSPGYLRLALGSHLAQYLRMKLEADFGYTSTCGISTNKVLSKLVGAKNKPRNQTTLLARGDDDVVAFMDGHDLRAVPGLGSKMTNLLEHHILSEEASTKRGADPSPSSLTVRHVRLHPTISPAFLETLLGGPGAERGIGARVWALLHGVDYAEVKEAKDVPSQISIEDTYKGLDAPPRITEELHKLSCSLILRMRVDLVAPDGDGDGDEDASGARSEMSRSRRWVARPRTLRLSVRSWPKPNQALAAQQQARITTMSRVSRSGQLPGFVFDLEADVDDIAQRLVADALWPLLRRLRADGGPGGWNLQLINVTMFCVRGG
ncbi:DNA polymerase iota [Escovopsis weberi]|uniref:DNA polymerase iota n=1 Tax=Escovopsis weberi TaxID=150374 RepID=A0A0M8N063_ESCWE|nr:DNA polymerase iota [Escovopsis weberi]